MSGKKKKHWTQYLGVSEKAFSQSTYKVHGPETIDNVQTQHLAHKARNTKKNCSLEMTNLELDTFDWNLTFSSIGMRFVDCFTIISPTFFMSCRCCFLFGFRLTFVLMLCMLIMPQGCSISKVRVLEEVAIRAGPALRTPPSMCPRALSHVKTQQKIIFPWYPSSIKNQKQKKT